MNKEGNLIKKFCAILMIISLLVSDFIFVGTSLVSYAIDAVTTTSSNVEFTAYFLDSNQAKTDKIQKNIDDGETKLYVDVSVKKEGYFNGQITLNNGNFDLKQEVTSSHVKSIQDNTVTLNQINAGSTITVELGIMPKTTEAILNTKTDVKLLGSYVDSKNVTKNKSIDIEGTASVELEWKSSSKTELELESKLLTNSIYKVDGEEKRIVQVLVNSRITDNNYPVKNTKITLNVPENVENVKVNARSTQATNKKVAFSKSNYQYNEQSKTLTIDVSNEEENNISWEENAQDSFVVTLEFDKDEIVLNKQIIVNSSIKTYDGKDLANSQIVHISNEIDGIVSGTIKTTEESIYKGKLYTGEERDYTQNITVNFDYLCDDQTITAEFGESVYVTNYNEIDSNILYKDAKINKQEFIRLFGEEGSITIKSKNQVIANINKNTIADENGLIILKNMGNYKNIQITASNPVAIGALHIETTKTILNTEYSKDIVDTFIGIKDEVTINNNKSEKIIELKNTETKATLKMVNTSKISTIAESQNIELEAVLDTSDESKDLYKNPKITLTLPEEIKITSFNADVLNLNGLELDKEKTQITQSNKVEIIFKGEQVTYDGTEGTVLNISLTIKTDKLTPSKNSEIKMTYTNDNNGSEKDETIEVEFESQYGLMIYNKFANYNNEKESIETFNSEEAFGTIDVATSQKAFAYGTAIINNFEDTISNVVLIGTIPAVNGEDTYKATLNNIEVDNPNAKIFYSEKYNADANDNSWGAYTSNSVSYKVEIPQMFAKEVVRLKATIILPEKIGYNKKGTFHTKTNCIFQGVEKENTSIVTLSTNANVEGDSNEVVDSKETRSGLNTKITVTAGNTGLINNDTIYEGQTLKYKVTVTNNSGMDYSKVTVTANQTNGYVWDNVETKVFNPFDKTTSNEHYYERTDKSNIVLGTIETLKSGESYTYSYEASANLIDKNQALTYGTINIISEDKALNENIETIKNKIKAGELQVDLNSAYTTELNLVSGNDVRSLLTIKNTTNEDLKDLEAKIVFSNNLISSVSIPQDISENVSYQGEKVGANGEKVVTLKITKISANDTITIELYPYTENKLEEKEVITWILAGVTTQANNTYVSNRLTRKVTDNSHNINLTQQGMNKNGAIIDTNKDKLNNGDVVNFVATVTNNENEEVNVGINYNIDKNIDVKSAKITSQNNEQDVIEKVQYNNINQSEQTIKPGETLRIDLAGTVDTLDIESVTNRLNVYDLDTGKSVDSNLSIAVNKLTEELVDLSDIDEEEPQNPQEETPSATPTDSGDSSTTQDPTGSVENPSQTQNVKTYTISGTAWIDKDKDGKKSSSEEKLGNITVEAVSLTKGKVLASTKTDSSGNYKITLEEGKYVLIFNYNNELYTTTTYKVNGATQAENSDAIERNIKFNGATKKAGITDTITLNSNMENVDIGLTLRSTFDLKLQKYVSKITVTNKAGTKTYEQKDGTTLAKAEIKAKNLKDSLVVIEYKIKVTNVGDVTGYAKQIVDLMPTSLSFNSKLNQDWYISGENLYNTSLSNVKLEPGESKELTLVLTKTMTETNTGLINNKAEIKESTNLLGLNDEKRDIGSADVIISVSTGTVVSYVISTITTFIIIAALAYFINKKYLSKRI